MSREVIFRESIDCVPLRHEWKLVAVPVICGIYALAAIFLEVFHVSIYYFEKRASDLFGVIKINFG
jgi:hypothetical protein